MWVVLRHNVDAHGDIQDSEPTGYEYETAEEASVEAANKNYSWGGSFVHFSAEEVVDDD